MDTQTQEAAAFKFVAWGQLSNARMVLDSLTPAQLKIMELHLLEAQEQVARAQIRKGA